MLLQKGYSVLAIQGGLVAKQDVLAIEPRHSGKKWVVKRLCSENRIHIADSVDEAIAFVKSRTPEAGIWIKDLCRHFAHLARTTE